MADEQEDTKPNIKLEVIVTDWGDIGPDEADRNARKLYLDQMFQPACQMIVDRAREIGITVDMKGVYDLRIQTGNYDEWRRKKQQQR